MGTAGESIRRQRQGRIALLEIDCPGRVMNVIDEGVLEDLARHLADIAQDEDVDAIVLASGKKDSFGAGADVAWLPELAARPDAQEFLTGVHQMMTDLVSSPKPVVAALKGPALGGALELALGSRMLIVADDVVLGFPEVGLGLLPGGGGTQLLTRFVSVATAADLLTTGRRIGANEAQDIGVAQLVVSADELVNRAVAEAARLVESDHRPVAPPKIAVSEELEKRRTGLARGRGGLTDAADQILTVLAIGLTDGLQAGLAAERRAFLSLLQTSQARAAIHLFDVQSQIRRRSVTMGEPVSRLAVVGGGQMGAGIAATAVTRGLTAVIRDVNEDSLQRAHSYLERVNARSPAPGDTEAASRWSGTTQWQGFADADVVIEAVFELPKLKTEVLEQLSEQVTSATLVATNTSAIAIGDLAGSIDHPGRFIGMHFFSPVERMPLVELIPHAGTSPDTASRAAALGRQLGKLPIFVGDSPGFFTSRVYARWLIEGLRLLLDGVNPGDIDDAAKAVGFPVGPMQAHDEATLELVLQASIGQVAERILMDRLDVAPIRDALESLIAVGIRGRRYGAGFYSYDESGKRLGPSNEVMHALGVKSTPLPPEVVGQRLLMAFVSECLLCWDEGILCHPDDGDVGAVLGIGFPRDLGGPFHWVDEIGAAEVIAESERLGASEFPVGDTVRRLVFDGGQLSELPRRSAPFIEPGE